MQEQITSNNKTTTSSYPPTTAAAFAVPLPMGPSTSTRSLKQRRVSLPGTSPLQSSKAAEVNAKNVDYSPWSFRDEMGLPLVVAMSSVSAASTPSATSSASFTYPFIPPFTATSTTSSTSTSEQPRTRKRANTTKSKSKPDTTPPPDDASSTPDGPTFATQPKPRKPRKRWTMEETQALVDGCNKVCHFPSFFFP